MEVIGLLILFSLFVAPIFVADRIGKRKNRIGWPWGLGLGWIGVVVVACLPTGLTAEESQIRELEAQLRIKQLREALGENESSPRHSPAPQTS